MKFGVREICDVVLKAKAAQKIGNKVFYKNEPVIYFDSLKTSSLEGQSTTVYAQGGRGNARLIGWDGERTVTFTMEDALISPAGIAILTGAGLIDAADANNGKGIIMHTTERIELSSSDIANLNENGGYIEIKLSEQPYIPGVKIVKDFTSDSSTGYDVTEVVDEDGNVITNGDTSTSTDGGGATLTFPATAQDYIYVMPLKADEPASEPFIPSELEIKSTEGKGKDAADYYIRIYAQEGTNAGLSADFDTSSGAGSTTWNRMNNLSKYFGPTKDNIVLVDYYVQKTSSAYEIDITPDKFGGNFYLEASTLFRDTNGIDLPAEFVIPNCKVQSNFTFTMASSGDPSTFTFTMDAFPDYTRWNQTKKVLAAIQVIDTSTETLDFRRLATDHDHGTGNPYSKNQAQFIEV